VQHHPHGHVQAVEVVQRVPVDEQVHQPPCQGLRSFPGYLTWRSPILE
jgi:hypothetical protein